MALVVFSGLSGKDSLGDAMLIRASACPGRLGQNIVSAMLSKTNAWNELQIVNQSETPRK
jgi:hypothetical protein